ncbi:MAG: hypothetical protein KGL39_57015 [Patescibacteria group bacterium]|nr:hypothetical protein [Patescibacteria group bacterium]
MRVLLATTWNAVCGVSEHSAMLKEAVEAVDPSIEIIPDVQMLDPAATPVVHQYVQQYDVLHLNYHAALHSRWQPTAIHAARAKHPVLVTYHDTGVPNSDQCKAVIDAADYAVVHEPFDDLPKEKTEYLRMGVSARTSPLLLTMFHPQQPVLGSIGFPFPWKHYEELARVTAAAGWGLLLLAPNATDEQVTDWYRLNPHIYVLRNFIPRGMAFAYLAGCDATAFTYVCHNTGQAGPPYIGIGARKPVIMLSTCRQFRALYGDPLAREMIRWCETFEDVARQLRTVPIQRVDPGMVALAEQESWAKVGKRYAEIYKMLAEGKVSQ